MATQRSTLPLHILKGCACNDIPWSQVFQCTNAHTICDKCHPKVNSCPECKIKLAQEIKIRSPMEIVLDTMDFDCPYKEKGCEEKLTRNKLSSHREKCGYGPSLVQLCKMFGLPCDFSVSSDKIPEVIRHFDDEHECLVQDSNEFTITLKSLVSSKTLSSPQDRIFSPVIVKSGEEHDSPVFLVVGIVKEKLLSMVSLFFGDYNPSYRCEFEIDKKHLNPAVKLSWTERPRGTWSKDFDLITAASVKVPLQVLKPYGTSNGSILVNMNIAGSEENIEVPRTLQLQSLVVTELTLQQEHSSGNTKTVGVGDITGTSGDWKGEQNPFLIKSVVKHFSKYLSFNELLLCRGLNSLWNEATEDFFWKLCPQVDLLAGFVDKNNVLISKRKLNISEFMEIYSDPDHPHPIAHLLRRFRKFRVTSEKILNVKQTAEFYEFLAKVGPQIASLELKDLNVLRSSQDYVDILLCKYMPNLQILILDQLKMIAKYKHQIPSRLINVDATSNLRRLILSASTCDYYHEFVEIGKIPWLDVLSRCPKLKVLCLNSFPSEFFEKILIAIVTIRQTDEANLNLIELEFSRSNRNLRWTTAEELIGWRRIGDLLRNTNVRLVKLDLWNFPNYVVPGLLEDCSKTLKSLTLYQIPQPFPLMQALKELDVLNCSNLNFLSNVPNLVSLSLKWSSSAISFPETIDSFMSLNKFHGCYYMTYNVTKMEQLFSLMPNIRVLEMKLNNNTFSWVCQKLPNLKELTVYGHELDDSGVVGYIEATTPEEDLRPNITDLRELESFQMIRSWKTVGLTEKSVFQGFCLMDKLSTLVITVQSELSAAAMRALKRKIKNVNVNIA